MNNVRVERELYRMEAITILTLVRQELTFQFSTVRVNWMNLTLAAHKSAINFYRSPVPPARRQWMCLFQEFAEFAGISSGPSDGRIDRQRDGRAPIGLFHWTNAGEINFVENRHRFDWNFIHMRRSERHRGRSSLKTCLSSILKELKIEILYESSKIY